LGKFLRLVINCLGIVLLISVVFLSAIQQVHPFTEQTIPLASSEAVHASYPNLTYSTFLGGSSGGELGMGIAVSEDGSYFITGGTNSDDFPTKNAFDNTHNGNRDVFITKFSSNDSLLWSTIFGGSDFEGGFSIDVGSDGSCYVMGITRSSGFPTKNAFDNTYNGYDDVFLAKFSAEGSLLWSSYLGGSEEDYGYSIAVASDGSCYVTGQTKSSDFPTQNAYESTFNGGNSDAFVSKFSTNGLLLWSTYLGGSSNDAGKGIAVTCGSCFVTGLTWSSDFPTLNANDSTHNGSRDAFITKFSADGSLLYSTFFGGSYIDEGNGIAVSCDDSFYVTGYTGSPDFPTINAFNDTYGSWGDVFVAKFTLTGTPLWSTFLGGNDIERGYDIIASIDGGCFVTGETGSTNFPTKNSFANYSEGNYDAFITKFSSEGDLLWSTYLSGNKTDKGKGIAVTNNDICYIIGFTYSPDFPTESAFDDTLGGVRDAFVTKYVNIPTLTPCPSKPPCSNTVNDVNLFLVFIAVLPTIAFIPVIALIVYKKRK